MSSTHQNLAGKAFVPFGFTSTMQDLIDVMSRPLNQPKKYKPITARLTTSDQRKIKINLNTCRPVYSSHYNTKIAKEKAERKEALEDLIIVWLDEHMNETENQFSKRKSDLRQIIDCLMAFNNADQCFKYIQNIKQEKIFLIVSESFGKTVMDDINGYSQIIFVYIFGTNTNHYKKLSKNYKKIMGAFANEHDLITQITKDASSFFHNSLPISVINSIGISEKSVQDLTKNQAQFMWSQILMKILLDLPQTLQSQQEFIEECRRQYKDNSARQNQITEFEKTYISSNALSWYTRDSFLYRIVNKALRTQNIIYIFKCRFFIIDVFQQLNKSYLKFIEPLEKKTLTVYRGQRMMADEFAKLQQNINGFISINTFFSTSISSDAVFSFIADGDDRPLYEYIFFEIELYLDKMTTPLANISTISNCQSENEVLLCMGTVFRIEFIDKLTDVIWHIKLVSIDKNDNSKLDNLVSYLKKETGETLNCLAMGRILQYMGEYDKAQNFYEILLTELPLNHPDMAGIYNDFGMALFKKQKNSKIALNYLIQSMTMQLKTFPQRFLFFTQTLINIASVYSQRRSFKRALGLLQLTLQVLELDCSTNNSQAIPLQQSDIYNNIGFIYSRTGRLSLAIKYFKMSLKIIRKIVPTNHPNIALSLNNIGMAYLENFDSSKADKYLQEAMMIVEECLPFEHHPDIARQYNNIGLLEYNRDNLDRALVFYEKALQIQLKCLSPIHRQTAALYNNMGHVYFEKLEYEMALRMFTKALQIEKQCSPLHYHKITHAHQNIGKTYRSLEDYKNALIHCTEALSICLKHLPSTHFYVAQAYRALGDVFYDLENYPIALENFQKALNIYLKNPPMDKTYLGMLYKAIGMVFYYTKEYDNALKHLNKALVTLRICDQNRFEESINDVLELIKHISTVQ
ncbi:unnamed protein product [Rotaria sp. Silwood2]|nr:unnamed protein product [Rotaria sp. Silwood2]CAF4142370.1 unnamed protein product [Rotaria sp. Silwood2]